MGSIPILVGSGQEVLREVNSASQSLSPIDLASKAALSALSDSGSEALVDRIDTLAMVRLFMDSVSIFDHPFGSSNKPPLSVAKRVGANPTKLIYGAEGGHSPQRFVNELADAIRRGESKAALICGAEATHAMKTALRNQWKLDWAEHVEGDIEDRGFKFLQTEVERSHGITFPPQVYALFENAWRKKHGLSVIKHQALMGRLFAGFSQVAAKNPNAQFPVARSAEFLAKPSPDNYPINIPYNKWLIAQDGVNQGAAVVMTSVDVALELGIPESQWVYLHGSGDADDSWVSERFELSGSEAIGQATNTALAAAGKSVSDMNLLDIYSCFPVAVLAACEEMGIDWQGDKPLTVTGGLPFFGGAGNNYSLHAVAEMTSRLRKAPGEFGLVSANGGYLSKQSVGVYSTSAPANSESYLTTSLHHVESVVGSVEVDAEFTGTGEIETYSLVYKKGQADFAVVIGRCSNSAKRFIAIADVGDVETFFTMEAAEAIGREVSVYRKSGKSFFTFI